MSPTQENNALEPMVDISPATDTPTLEELKEHCRDKIARMFAEKLPEVAQGMINLALTSEVESVRFRAQARILDEFQAFQGKPQQMPQTNVQIINAIPFERSAYDAKGKELEQVDIGNLRVATPTYKQVKPSGYSDPKPSKDQFGGKKQSAETVDSMRMDRLSPADYREKSNEVPLSRDVKPFGK